MNILNGSRILITGGTGSLGTALVKRLLSGKNGKPDSITVFSRDELKQSEMRAQIPDGRLHFIIGDVRDRMAIELALPGTDILFNAAAMKRVETCERNPAEAIKTNCLGSINITETIQKYRLPVHTVIGVSSDKGCHPQNNYGASKLLQERILLAANFDNPNTRYIAVCYGNVLASRGSVIPIFQEQVSKGGPVTVRNPDMTRFLITLDEAVDTLMAALFTAKRGEVYIPIIPSASVGDIADVIIGNKNIPIQITGAGPGEKLHETLITEEDAPKVERRNGFYVVTDKYQSEPILTGEYSSKDYLLTKAQLRDLFIDKGYVENEEISHTWRERDARLDAAKVSVSAE